MRNSITSLLALAAAASFGSAASAAVYTDQASFLAANPGTSLVSFEGQTTSLTPVASDPLTFGGLTFTGVALYNVDSSFWGSVDSLLDNAWNGFIEVSGFNADAVGFYFASNYNSGTAISFKAFNGATEILSTTITGGGVYDSFAYFGFDGLGDVTSIRLDAANGGFVSIAEVSTGLGAVPEPATWAMFIAGFGLVGAAVRRRSAVAA